MCAAKASQQTVEVPDFHLDDGLQSDHVAFFERHGFIRFRNFLPRQRADELRAALDEVTANLVNKQVTQINGIPLVGGAKADGTPIFGRIPFASLQHPVFKAYLDDPRLPVLVEGLAPGYRIGERERDGLVVNRFRNDVGAKYKNLGWHTDSLRDLAYFEKPRKYLNVGFSITDSPLAVGGLRVLPGTHEQSVWSMLTRKLHFFDLRPDPNELAIETRAGDLTVHDGRLWHRTGLAELRGDASERVVMYLPVMTGPVIEKNADSPMPSYFRLRKLLGY